MKCTGVYRSLCASLHACVHCYVHAYQAVLVVPWLERELHSSGRGSSKSDPIQLPRQVCAWANEQYSLVPVGLDITMKPQSWSSEPGVIQIVGPLNTPHSVPSTSGFCAHQPAVHGSEPALTMDTPSSQVLLNCDGGVIVGSPGMREVFKPSH